MPKRTKQDRRSSPVNPLANYLVTESTREVEKPDRPTDAQISLLMAESRQKARQTGSKHKPRATEARRRTSAASKATRSRRAKKRKR